MIICSRCGTNNESNLSQCKSCHSVLSQKADRVCQHCHQVVAKSAVFCDYCGSKIVDEDPVAYEYVRQQVDIYIHQRVDKLVDGNGYEIHYDKSFKNLKRYWNKIIPIKILDELSKIEKKMQLVDKDIMITKNIQFPKFHGVIREIKRLPKYKQCINKMFGIIFSFMFLGCCISSVISYMTYFELSDVIMVYIFFSIIGEIVGVLFASSIRKNEIPLIMKEYLKKTILRYFNESLNEIDIKYGSLLEDDL